MDNDDLPIGRVLSRREVLILLGAAGALLVLGCSSDGEATTPSTTDGTWVVKPELTEGPY